MTRLLDVDLSGARSKCAWAMRRFRDLQTATEQFLARDPWTIEHRVHPPTRTHALVFKVIETPPEEMSLLVGEIAHNARSALDHCVYAFAREAASESHQFPIETEVARWRPSMDRRLRDVPSDVVELIERIQPFNAPDAEGHPLALLRWISNTDKHRVLHPTFAQIGEIMLFAREGQLGDAVDLRVTRAGPLPDGTPVATWRIVDADSKLEIDSTIHINVVFGRATVRANALLGIVDSIQTTVSALEALTQPRQNRTTTIGDLNG